MSVPDLWHNDHDPSPPGPEETIWLLLIKARLGSGAGYDELKEYLQAVKLYGEAVLESAKFIKGRKVLQIRVRSFKHDPEAFNWVFTRELETWPELEIIESKEEGTCQAHT